MKTSPFIFILSCVCTFLLLSTNSTESSANTLKSKTIVFLGDSLTEGYGVAKESSFPSLIQKKLDQEKLVVKVVNAGISGSTTASALSRLTWQLKQNPDVLFLALGANDGLRGLPIAQSRENLSKAIELAKSKNVKVILAGMLMPPNYGEKYRKEFEGLFKELAKKYQLVFVPFLLEGVAGKSELNLPDGIHPNEAGHKVIADKIYSTIKSELL